MKKVAVVGTGHIGFVTGTCLAETDNTVICVDINQESNPDAIRQSTHLRTRIGPIKLKI